MKNIKFMLFICCILLFRGPVCKGTAKVKYMWFYVGANESVEYVQLS